MVQPSGLCSKFIPVPPTQSLAVSWEHGRDAVKASYRREEGEIRVLLSIFWFFPSGEALICFRGKKEQGLSVFCTR